MARFPMENYKSLDELVYRAVSELSNNDLLYIRKFGRNGQLAAGVAEDIWVQGGIKALPLDTAETIDIVSASTNDTLGGSGAQILQISGVDDDYNLVTETINLNGTTTVTTTNTFKTVNRVRTVFHGSGQTNAGDITCTYTTDGSTVALVESGTGITQQSHFTVPAGYTLFTTDVVLSAFRSSGSGTRRAYVDQMIYVPAANAKYRTIRIGVSSESPYVSQPTQISQTPAKTTLWYEATAEANNTAITSSVGYLLVKGDFNYRTEL